MADLYFENRISLTRKSEDLTKMIVDLSSDYENRDDFMRKHPCTSEISVKLCIPGLVCVLTVLLAVAGVVVVWLGAGVVAAAAAGAVTYAACATETLPCNDFANVDIISYKDVV